MILNEMKENIKGNVKLMFQPAEEGPGGAKPMIEEGVLENPKVDGAFSCHIWPMEEAGKILVKNGDMMAHTTSFDIIIQGKGGHGSQPHVTIDPIIVGSEIVSNFQNIISRNISSLTPAVLSFGSINAGEAYNVIPDKLTLKGTIRTFDEKLTDKIIERMEDVLSGIKKAYGNTYELNVYRMYPALKNNSKLYELSKKSFGKVIGERNVIDMSEPLMGSEDFSYVSSEVPANYFLVGVKEIKDEFLLHHPKFIWNDKYLKISSAALAQVALDFLDEDKDKNVIE
jgi:amidohydrolase